MYLFMVRSVVMQTILLIGADNDFNVTHKTGENNVKDKLRATPKVTRLGLDFSTPVGDNKARW